MGILSKAMKKNAVVLQKPSEAIAIRVELDAVQRKFYNALLFIAKKELMFDVSKKRFTIPFNELKEILNKNEKDKNNSYYIEKLKEIKYKNAEYNILEKSRRAFGWVSLVSDLKVEEDKETKIVNVMFELPETIKEAIIDPDGIYANINLVVIRGLQSKYAIILYELVKDYHRVEVPEMPMQTFKKIFGIEEKYIDRIDRLKSRVLDVAVNELNNNENIDFLVSYKFKKTGAKYTHIKFEMKPKPVKLKKPQQIKQLENHASENNDLKDLLILVPKEYRNMQKVVSIVLAGLDSKGKDYTMAQVRYCVEKYNKNKIRDFVVYLKKAIEEDYAGFEKIDIGIITVEDAIGCRLRGKTDGGVTNTFIIADVVKSATEGQYHVCFKSTDDTKIEKWIDKDEDWLLDVAKKKIELAKSRTKSEEA